MAIGDYAGLRAERRAGRLAEIKEREEGALKRARIAAAAGKKLPMAGIETPAATVPFLPESREKGRLGDIMRASPEELESIFERMPETKRPVETIRGTERAYWSPGTKQEYGDLRTAMTGFKQRPAMPLKTAQAEQIRSDIEAEKGTRGSVESILATRAAEQKLGLEEASREVRLRDEAGIGAAMKAETEAEAEVLAKAAKPGRKVRPSLKRFLWEGRPEIGAPGLGAPIKGYQDIAGLLGEYLGKGYEYAFPRTK
jgi:hypothetical protein